MIPNTQRPHLPECSALTSSRQGARTDSAVHSCTGTTSPRVLRDFAAARELQLCNRANARTQALRTTIPSVLCALAAAETNMASRIAAFLKNAWAKEPVLVVSFTIGGLAIILPPLSPYTKYASMINQATPYSYPVPLRDDGNMPDVPSHPQDPQGPSLEWLKKL
ncbi:NADH dehydrogenase [ubiquinone] 1 alpha subcomplex subunit 3 [Rhynchocyon petersi]